MTSLAAVAAPIAQAEALATTLVVATNGDAGNPGSLRLDRNTAWRNGGTGFDNEGSTSTLARNLSVGNGTPSSSVRR